MIKKTVTQSRTKRPDDLVFILLSTFLYNGHREGTVGITNPSVTCGDNSPTKGNQVLSVTAYVVLPSPLAGRHPRSFRTGAVLQGKARLSKFAVLSQASPERGGGPCVSMVEGFETPQSPAVTAPLRRGVKDLIRHGLRRATFPLAGRHLRSFRTGSALKGKARLRKISALPCLSLRERCHAAGMTERAACLPHSFASRA